ncbi:MAG: 2-iminoacetate synthase ThiH, partial [Desulfobacteraceae bacterium]|nr:2-iminoacetate synthase ThiH [Desulfobacteraceae bacterium]
MSFFEEIDKFRSFNFEEYFNSVTGQDIERSLDKNNLNKFDLLNLLSDAATQYIEQMAQQANKLTIQYFGRVISLYAPIYISDYCTNHCTYCGFNRQNKFKRKKLSIAEIEDEAKVLSATGIKHVLLLTGEDLNKTPVSYLVEAIKVLTKYFSSIALEIFPMDTKDYKTLINAGADSLTVYQEVYNKGIYKNVHPKGMKQNYKYRLLTPERGAVAGFRAINIGPLFGLGNVQSEAFFAGLHAKYLEKNHPTVEVSVSVPRMRKAEGGISPKNLLTDKTLVQFMLALRLYMPRLGISISTREPAWLRDKLIYLGATKFSAGSKTDVGGYSKIDKETTPQFELSDTRSVDEVAQMIRDKGYQVVFKD